jgi:pyruvate formate lyase activating enzyme
VCPSTALEFDSSEYTAAELVEVFLKDEVFYRTSGGGITLSGGEPLFQPDFAKEVLTLSQEAGLHTAVETTLHVQRSTLEPFVGLVDHFMTDVKLVDSGKHRTFTGVGNELIHDNLRWLASQEVTITVRLPLIPGATATEENVRAVAAFVADLPGELPLELINFNPLASGKYLALDMSYEFANVTSPFEADEVAAFAELARGEGAKVV